MWIVSNKVTHTQPLFASVPPSDSEDRRQSTTTSEHQEVGSLVYEDEVLRICQVWLLQDAGKLHQETLEGSL